MSQKKINGFTLLEVTISMVMMTLLAVGTAEVMTSQRGLVVRSEEKFFAMQMLEQEVVKIKSDFMNQSIGSMLVSKTLVSPTSNKTMTIQATYWTQNKNQESPVLVAPAVGDGGASALASETSATQSMDQEAFFMRVDLEISWEGSDAHHRLRKETLTTSLFRERNT